MRATHRLQFAALAAALLSGACSDSSTGPGVAPADLTSVLSEMSLSSTLAAVVPTGGSMISGVVPGSMAITPSACAYSASSQSFACPTISATGLTMSRSFQLLTAGGAPQSSFDRTTTAAVRTMAAISGSIPIGTDKLNVSGSDTSTLSGLLTGAHVLDGRQLIHSTGVLMSEPMDMTSTTVIAGLRLPAQAGPNSYPLGGTITSTVNFAATPTSPAFNEVTTMTFNGTSKVQVTTSGFGGTHTCVIDLAVPTRTGLASGCF